MRENDATYRDISAELVENSKLIVWGVRTDLNPNNSTVEMIKVIYISIKEVN